MRVIRDYTTSQKINQLSPEAEVFFFRLLQKADDYGNFYREVQMLRSALFPISPRVRLSQLDAWLQQCIATRLISEYESPDKRKYIHVHNFNQKLRWRKRIFPVAPFEGKAEVEIEVEEEVDIEEKRGSIRAPALDEFKKMILVKEKNILKLYFGNVLTRYKEEVEKLQRFADRRTLEIAALEEGLREKSRAQLAEEVAARDENLFFSICRAPILKECEAFYDYYSARNFIFNNNQPINNYYSAFYTWLRKRK